MVKYQLLSYKLRFVGLYIVTISTLFHETHSQNATVEDFTRLIKDRITAFDNRTRPLLDQSKTLLVRVKFNLLSILQVKEKQQQIQLNAWLNFSWVDEIRRWNPSDYGGIYLLHPRRQDIWIPQVIVDNSLGKRDLFADNCALMALFSTGRSTWYPGAIFTLSCELDITYFPFDTQHCEVNMWGNDYASDVNYMFSDEIPSTDDYIENSEWELVSSHDEGGRLKDGQEAVCLMNVLFVIRRRPKFYFFVIIIPCMLMSYLSFFGFIIPYHSTERSTYVVTVLVSLSVYMSMVSSEIPPLSNPFPIILNYIFSLMVLSGFSVIVVIVLNRYQQDTSDVMISPHQRWRFLTSKMSTKRKSYARSENSSYGLAPIMDSKSKQLDDGVTPKSKQLDDGVTPKSKQLDDGVTPPDGTIQRLSMMNEKTVVDVNTNANSDPEDDTRASQSRVMSNANPRKSKTSRRNSCCYAVKKFCGVFKVLDFQLFLIFTLMWTIISFYYLRRMAGNS